MAKRDNYLADEVHRVLNCIPLTRTVKRSIRRNLLKNMDEQQAAQLTIELKAGVANLAAVLEVIRRSKDIPRK
jgi:hypothetical protein